MHEVPVKRASSVDDIQRGDHTFLDRTVLFHHAIVESVDTRNGEANIIEYTNTAADFIQDNSGGPKNPGKAKVQRGKIKFDTNENLYVIKHTSCFDPETVISRAESKLGEREYNTFTNNCEHFALWCKTGVSSSEQINKATDALKVAGTCYAKKLAQKEIVKTVVSREVTKEIFSHAMYSNGQDVVSTGVRALSKKVVTGTTEKIGQEVVKTGIEVTKEVASHAMYSNGQDFVSTGVRALSKKAVTGTTEKIGQEVVKTGIEMTKQIAVETTVKVGKETTKTGMNAVTKQAAVQAASNSGKEMVTTGFRSAPKEVFKRSVTTTGQGVVTTGVRSTTRKFVTNTVSKTGKEVFKTGTRKTTKEVVTKTTSQVKQEATGVGLACAIAIEGISVLYDINCAYKDKQAGKISQSEFENAVESRVVMGTANVTGSTVGAAIGQAVCPIPVVGGFVGGIAGSFIVKYIAGLPFRQ